MEPGHTLVAEVIADVRAEKAAFRFCTEEGLVIGGRELEVAIDMAGVAESQIEHLLGIVIAAAESIFDSSAAHFISQFLPAELTDSLLGPSVART